MLEIVFEEMKPEKYAEELKNAMANRFNRQLTNDQMELLAQSIEQARQNGYSPIDLAEELDELYEEIF